MNQLSAYILVCFQLLQKASSEYEIGVGIADVTGPIVEVGFMGYGKFDQIGTGLHLRQWARSFIISDKQETLVFVNVDVGMIGDGLRIQVLNKLQAAYGDLYNSNNVIISGTHTHSAPGGFLLHFLFDLPIKGFSEQTFWSLVNGIVKSIERAHANRKQGQIFIAKDHVYNANINRSPTAYDQNPAEERARYGNNTDTEMVQLKFFSVEGEPLGAINWFPVHPTSMNNTNTLVSSDNVGYAAIKFEERMNPRRILGQGPFVAAFASSNLGDVSPNLKGPRCSKSGRECDMLTSSCPQREGECIAAGPGNDMFESTAIIADRLYQKALDLWNSPAEEVEGPVKATHQYVDMTKAEADITTPDGTTVRVRGCPPAMGYSFAAGTTDGPGAFSFKQGTISTNPMWNLVRNILSTPTRELVRCQAPKPILLATGQMVIPFDWQPKIVSTQLGLIGNVALIAVPGEFTTMAGRRMKEAIMNEMLNVGFNNPTPIIAGLCNTYSDYITTYEEYQIQRYEGASTIFGPHTLSLHLEQYRKLMRSLLQNQQLESGPIPPGLQPNKPTFILPVVFDNPRLGYRYGQVIRQPDRTVRPGKTVRVRFISSNPRNNLYHDATFCTVERKDGSNMWEVVATDANWDTKVKWYRTSDILGNSEVEIEWLVPNTAQPGVYRIRHFNTYKYIFGGLFSFQGTSQPFKVMNEVL